MENPDDDYFITAFDRTMARSDAGFGSDHLGSTVVPYGGMITESQRFTFGRVGKKRFIKVYRPDSSVKESEVGNFYERYLGIASLCPDETVFTGWFISAAAHFFPPMSTYIWTNIEELNKRNVIIVRTNIKELFNKISEDYSVQDIQGEEIFDDPQVELSEGVIYGVFCVGVLVLGKTPGEYWSMFVKRRAEAYDNVEWSATSSEIQGYSPRQKVALFLHQFLSPLYSFKIALIKSMEVQAITSEPGSECFRSTLILLRYHGMTQFFHIHRYLYSESHPCLYIPSLRGEIELYSVAVDKFLKIPEEERPFIKILWEPSRSAFIHRERFPQLSVAATHIAVIRGKTNMRNYVPYKLAFEATHNQALLAVIDAIEKARNSFVFLPREKEFRTRTNMNQSMLASALRSAGVELGNKKKHSTAETQPFVGYPEDRK